MKLYKRENGTWYVDYFIEGKRYRTSLKTQNKKIAAELAEEIYQNSLRETFGLQGEITLWQAIDDFILYSRNNKKSLFADQGKVPVIFSFFNRDLKLKNLKASDLEEFRIWLRKERGIKKSSINRYCAFIKSAINLAIKNEKFDRANPVSKIKYYKETPRMNCRGSWNMPWKYPTMPGPGASSTFTRL